MGKLIYYFKNNAIALVGACVVGFLCVAPQFLAIHALGNKYQGVQFLYVDDEDNYMATIRDITEGHWLASSPEFYEYKAITQVMVPFNAYPYALAAKILPITLSTILIASKFLLPALLFLLIYALVGALTGLNTIAAQLNACAAGLLVTLGYDLVDYHSALKVLLGQAHYPVFQVWTRPVNPVMGAIALVAVILLILKMYKEKKWYLLFVIGLLQAAMISYFFSWGICLAVTGTLCCVSIVRKEYWFAKKLAGALLIGITVALPFILKARAALSVGQGYSLAARNGMFFTHTPIVNKFLLFVAIVFFVSFACEYTNSRHQQKKIENWWWVCFALIVGSFLAFNQQIITGRTIWPYHFVQYTIPLALIVFSVVMYNFVRPRQQFVWVMYLTIAIIFPVWYGVAAAETYRYKMNDFANIQDYAPLFSWVNANTPPECVILTTPSAEGARTLIPAFTHCNTYTSGQVFSIPEERVLHDLLVTLRLKKIDPADLANYLYAHPHEVSSNFFPDWLQMFSPDTSRPWFGESVQTITAAYKPFYLSDFASQLKKYHLDYILSEDPEDTKVLGDIAGLRILNKIGKMTLYRFLPSP